MKKILKKFVVTKLIDKVVLSQLETLQPSLILKYPLYINSYFYNKSRITLNYRKTFLKITLILVSAFPAINVKDDYRDGIKLIIIFVRDSNITGPSKRLNIINYGHIVF